MPLKFLKKSRHYNVTSKSLFVISVHHLLDTSTTVDCTLSSESKGQECLDNVCQRLSISQPELFGLRFIVKGKEDELKWIDLDRPLSRQLEKYAAGPKIFLRVLHYVTTGVKHLSDEVSRYYYFLQLKNDVVEERIACDVRTAILLALYCRQAEYDSYQRDKHTKDYLRTRLILPKSLMHDGFDESLIDEVQQLNPTIQHLSQSQAEEMYIKCCQRLDGYGEERFSAKDSLGNDIQLGLTINGIVVNSQIGRQYYPWKDFLMVVNAKRSINIEQKKDELIYTVASFTLPDADTARYIWKLCVTQHIFFKNYIDEEADSENGGIHPESIQNFAQDFGDSREDLLLEQQRAIYTPEFQMVGPGGVQNSIMSSNISLATSSQHQQARTPNQSWANIPQEYASSTNCSFTNMVVDPLDNRVQSTSCLDLSNNNNFSHERERLKAMLPTYRPAPDYETAVQQKYRASSNEIHNINHQTIASAAALRVTSSGAMLSPDPNFYSGSQPDVHNMSATENILHHLAPHRYPDVTQTAQTMQNQINPNNVYTNIDLAQRLQMMRTKPPPPYPANRLSSTSTPDLAVASHRTLLGYRAYVSGSSPDLVSNRNLLSNQYHPIVYPYMNHIGHSQPYLAHGTFENLNMIEEQPSLVLPLPPPTQQPPPPPLQQQIPTPPQQIYRPPKFPDTNGGGLQRSAMNGSIEPIYENVPLPHCYTSENSTEMRNRTSSIQSAPGGIHQATPIAQMHSEIDGITLNMQRLHTNSNGNGGLPQMETTNDTLIQMNLHKPPTPTLLTTPPRHEKLASPSPIAPPRKANLMKTTSDVLPHPSKNFNDDHYNTSHSSSSYLNSTQTTLNTTLDSVNTSTASSATKEKRKKRWNILGRSKNSAEKERKSATLGRDKSKNQVKVELSQEEMNLRHRWSTGLPRLQPISATYSKDKLCQILDAKLNDSQLFMEFERIPKRRESARYECALLEENMRKNSDPNFLPYDDNRVRITPSMENRHGYVNASHISATVGTKQRFYIVAQSPQVDLMKKMFWQCVWEADVYLIVQLSEELNYIPPDTNQRLEFGQFQVYQEFSQTTDRCITSKLRLYHVQSRRYRSVWHLNYTDWAEQNCPREVNHFLDFLEELNSVRMASINEVPPGHNTNPPVLIHCLEGGGRSGVALTADLLLYTLDHNEDLDIPRVIGQLRHQRDSIIPSLAQYKFIYALLITYLKRTRLI
ncbi:tyrosine-protein phosphatase non-receptor type 14 [Eupeodes corollae]|uniref:tyrosine-protein phosphatase non-receptor type 14 n=1 Tax=Eupeodes corollae TaxID=290404 RepID=UPI002491C2E4|nr:tyrosine-protein phosphatase non-receptor type 14 [Eupeodes corollae]